MPNRPRRTAGWLSAALLLTLVASTQAQTRLPKPIIGTPTVVTGPASLTATASPGRITLVFPPVANAQGYRVTRASDAIGNRNEVTIYEGPATTFASPDNGCSTTSSQPNCIYVDTRVNLRLTYVYRVWTIYPGALVSPPSPPAAIHAQ